MSLVREALEKAEREAAARDAREKGLPSSLSAAGQPYRARRRRGVPGLVATVVVTAASVLAIFWVATRTANVAPSADPAAAPTATTRGADDRNQERTATGDAESSLATGEEAEPTPPAAGGPTERLDPIAQAPAPEGSTPPTSRSAAAPTTTTRPAPVAPAEEVARDLDLGDGTALHLGGIAWSDAAPLAYLGGRLVGVGESVGSFRVERIERERVLLVSRQRTVWITLRPN